MEIIFKSPSGKTGRIPANNKEAIIELLQKGYNLDEDPTFKSPSGKTGRIPANNKEAIIELLQKGYNFEPPKKTPKVEEKGFLNSLADEAKMINATLGRSLDDFTNLPANLLQMGYGGFKKGIDSLGNNAELGANPELGISADDISRMQQSDPSYNPFNKENTLGQIARIPNTIFNKTAEGIGSLTGMEDNKYYNDDRAYEENLENANLLKKLVHGGIYYGAPGALTRLPFQGLANAAKFGAVSTGIQQATGANPIVADIVTALDPIGKAKKIGKIARSPIENIIYPLAKRKVGDIDVDAVETSARLLGDNTASIDNFRTGEGLDSLSSNLAHIGSRGYKNQQANSLNAFNSKLDEIGQNIGGTSQELKEVYTPLYERVKKEAAEFPSQRLDEYTEFLEKIKKNVDTPNKTGTTEGEIYNDTNSQLSDFYGKEYIETADKIKQIPKPIEVPQIIKMIQNNNEKLGDKYYKGKPFISDTTKHSNYLKESNLVLDKILKKILPKETYQTLKEANETFGQGKSRDSFEKLLDPTFDYAGNRLKIDKTARMLNTPKDIKVLKALAKKEDHPKLDDLAKISQRIYKTNARNAGRTGSGQTNTGEEVAYEAAKAAIETAITGKTPTGIVPLITRYTYGQVMGDLMVSPKFRDYMIRVSKNPKDTQAKLAMDAMIQKKTGLTTKQLSTILARDSVNKLTIDKNEESGK
jgi:hypothetical protein